VQRVLVTSAYQTAFSVSAQMLSGTPSPRSANAPVRQTAVGVDAERGEPLPAPPRLGRDCGRPPGHGGELARTTGDLAAAAAHHEHEHPSLWHGEAFSGTGCIPGSPTDLLAGSPR
jgi:hypothetical protein